MIKALAGPQYWYWTGERWTEGRGVSGMGESARMGWEGITSIVVRLVKSRRIVMWTVGEERMWWAEGNQRGTSSRCWVVGRENSIIFTLGQGKTRETARIKRIKSREGAKEITPIILPLSWLHLHSCYFAHPRRVRSITFWLSAGHTQAAQVRDWRRSRYPSIQTPFNSFKIPLPCCNCCAVIHSVWFPHQNNIWLVAVA
jgi:hypothetical protein